MLFYTEKSDWQYVAATSADVVDYWRWHWRCCGLAVFKKPGRFFISIGWLALLLLSLQPVADRLLRPIESTYPTWNNSQKKWTISWCSEVVIHEPAVGTEL